MTSADVCGAVDMLCSCNGSFVLIGTVA